MKIGLLEKNILYMVHASGEGGFPIGRIKDEVVKGLRELAANGYINALENDVFMITDKGKKAIRITWN